MSNPQRFFRHSRVVYNASLDAMIRLLSRNSEVVNFSGLKHSRSEARIVSGIICARAGNRLDGYFSHCRVAVSKSPGATTNSVGRAGTATGPSGAVRLANSLPVT